MRGTLFVGIAVAGALAVALSGCTFTVRGPADVVVTDDATTAADAAALAAEWKTEYEAFVAEYGAEATGTELTEDDARATAAASADKAWALVVEQYPDAVRPAAEFVAWRETGPIDRQSPILQCIDAAGLPIDEGSVAGGGEPAFGWSATSKDERIAEFACSVAYPSRPVNLEVFLTWVWAYNTHFLRPCLEAHGLPQEPLPDIDEYITGSIGWSVDWGEDWEADLAAQPDPAVAADCRYRG